MNIQREGAVPAEYVHADNDWDADNQGKGNVVEAKQQCAGRKKRPQAETLHDDPQAKCHYCTVNYYNCDVLKNKAHIAQADGSLPCASISTSGAAEVHTEIARRIPKCKCRWDSRRGYPQSGCPRHIQAPPEGHTAGQTPGEMPRPGGPP